MKKIVAILFAALCMAAFALAGCAPEEPPAQGSGIYHTVTFDSRGGSEVASQQVRDGNPVVRPDPPARDGYFLNGWYTEEDVSADSEWHFGTDRVTADMTLYAGWTSQSDLTPTGGLVYELNEERTGYTVTDYAGEATQLVIPAEYEGLPVTAIQGIYGTGALSRTDIASVFIPDTIEVIGQNSFYNCDCLAEVVISASSNLAEIGNNAFSGCISLESMYIPAEMTTLGNAVFNNCGGLNEFVVAEGNPAYRAENGHLIESATNTLVRGVNDEAVPEGVERIEEAAFRRANGITRLYIPATVTEIGDDFIADSTITAVLYAGTEAQWNAIEKTDMWNHGNRDVVLEYSAAIPEEGSDILVVYFSATGNTERVAGYIAGATGGMLWEIVAADPYTAEDIDYTVSDSRANVEQRDASSRPAVAGRVENFADYDTVFIGHPIWQGIAPRIIQTFLESYDFSGKDVYTFSTSASSSGSGAFNALSREYSSVNLIENLHFTSRTLSGAQTRVNEWIAELGLAGGERAENNTICLTVGNTTAEAELYDNATARDLLSRLPLTLEFSDYNNTEKIAYLPNNERLDTSGAPASFDPSVGDVTVYAPWGNLAVFYRDFRLSSGLVPVGKLNGEAIELFASQNGNFTVTIAAA